MSVTRKRSSRVKRSSRRSSSVKRSSRRSTRPSSRRSSRRSTRKSKRKGGAADLKKIGGKKSMRMKRGGAAAHDKMM